VVPLVLAVFVMTAVCTVPAPGPATASAAIPGADRAATSAPAVVAAATGGYDVFYRGWDGAVFERTLVAGTWSAPTSLGGSIVGAPAAAAIGADVVLVTRGPVNGLNVRIRAAGRWSAWRPLGLTVTAPPAVAAWTDGRVDVVARAQDARLYTRVLHRTTPTTPWRRLSAGAVASGPAVTATGAGRLTVLVTGPAHDVLRRTLAGHVWSAWTSLGARTYEAPAVAAVPGTGRVLAAVRGTGNQLFTRELPGGSWQARGGLLIDGPAVAGSGSENLVVVRSAAARLYSRTVSGTSWSGYRPAWAPAPVPPPPAALLGIDWTGIPTTRKVIALTFDGGANADGYAAIRTTLQRTNARATFFLTGEWVRTFPAQVIDVAQNGFMIGNHTDTHPHLPPLTDAQITAQLRRAETAILRANGTDTRPLFRFPYEDVDNRVLADVNRLGYVAVGWTIDTLGWEGTSGGITVQKVIDRVLTRARPGAVVLMHIGSNPKDRTTLDAAALPTVITRLRARGYSFVTLNALTG
jgi:peptidoglycan/xylan/chitin deacetylase (PgdA/CDA1 family)